MGLLESVGELFGQSISFAVSLGVGIATMNPVILAGSVLKGIQYIDATYNFVASRGATGLPLDVMDLGDTAIKSISNLIGGGGGGGDNTTPGGGGGFTNNFISKLSTNTAMTTLLPDAIRPSDMANTFGAGAVYNSLFNGAGRPIQQFLNSSINQQAMSLNGGT